MLSAYRRLNSTAAGLFRVHNNILNTIDKYQGVLLALLDFKAAFDRSDHNMLLSRLSVRYGTRGIG